MVTSGCRKPLVVVVVADTEKPIPPCGACRQVIAEFNPNAVVVMYSTKSRELVVKNLAELLPSPFSLR
jgi:cytidine deaminase